MMMRRRGRAGTRAMGKFRGSSFFGERRQGLAVYGQPMKLPFSRFLAPLSLAVGLLFGAGLAEGAEPRTVIAYGDSITQGGALGAAEKGKLWVTLVEAQSGGKLKLVNEGKGGRPTKSLPEFEAMLTRQPKADALIIALGANDARLDIKETCVPNAVANVTKMIELARKAYGAKLPILLVGPTNIRKDALGPSKPIANEREAKVKELGEGFEKLAKEQGCAFVNLYGVVPDASLAKDGVHPDGAGNEAMAKVLLPAVVGLGS